MNLTKEVISKIWQTRYRESNTQYWTLPGGAHEIKETNEVFLQSILADANITKMKTIMTISGEKDKKERNFVEFFFRTKLEFSPHIND